MEPWPGRPEVCKSVDLLAPEGYGEIIGGSERMSIPDLLLQRIHEHGLPEEAYSGISTCASLALFLTPVSGWAWKERLPGSAASSISVKQFPFRERSRGCIRNMIARLMCD